MIVQSFEVCIGKIQISRSISLLLLGNVLRYTLDAGWTLLMILSSKTYPRPLVLTPSTKFDDFSLKEYNSLVSLTVNIHLYMKVEFQCKREDKYLGGLQ